MRCSNQLQSILMFTQLILWTYAVKSVNFPWNTTPYSSTAAAISITSNASQTSSQHKCRTSLPCFLSNERNAMNLQYMRTGYRSHRDSRYRRCTKSRQSCSSLDLQNIDTVKIPTVERFMKPIGTIKTIVTSLNARPVSGSIVSYVKRSLQIGITRLSVR